MTDVIVVGSGPGGTNAAAALIEAGRSVLLLDYGNEDTRYPSLIPRDSFTRIRRTDRSQHRYFLGDRFEGIPVGPVSVGAQLTPPRLYVFADAAELLPVESHGFSVLQSLAKGGLGAAWSGGVSPFTESELKPMGLTLDDLQSHYDAVSERIGVCGEQDDLDSFFPSSPSMMPALEVDSNAEAILRSYQRKRATFHSDGFFLGRPRIAACTQKHRGRGPHDYRDMAFWTDMNRSIYRPQWTLEELHRSRGFQYLDRRLVQSFAEHEGGVSVKVHHADSHESESHTARALVLAAGAIGSARLALRSLGRDNTPVPILCNPYSYIPMLNLGLFGRQTRDRRYSMGQLTAIVQQTAHGRLVLANVFSYRSLLMFKLLKQSPFGYRDSLRILRLLAPYLAILGVHHEDRPTKSKVCLLRPGSDNKPGHLEIRYRLNEEERRLQRASERLMCGFFRRLGCWPLKVSRLVHGSSLHYAGTLPMCPDGGELTCDRYGRLRGTHAVFISDASVFPKLPAKGLTFTLMAHANRVGTLLATRLEGNGL